MQCGSAEKDKNEKSLRERQYNNNDKQQTHFDQKSSPKPSAQKS